MGHDLLHALRRLRRRPEYTAAATLMLGVATAATTVILSLVYGVALKPLPFHDPGRLVAVWPERLHSNQDLVALRERAAAFASVAAAAPGWMVSLTDGGEPTRLSVTRTSGNLFSVLGVRPVLGRVFAEDDARPAATPVVLVTHHVWTTRFQAQADVVGRVVQLDGEPFTVAGVLPADFELLGLKADAYTPFTLDTRAWYHQLSFSHVVARLAPGWSVDAASGTYRDLLSRLREERGYPTDFARTATVEPLQATLRPELRSTLTVLGISVLIMLAVAHANVGSLVLTGVARRRREWAVHVALGASQGRLLRGQALEAAILTLGGTATGIGSAALVLPALVTRLPPETPRMAAIGLHLPVVLLVMGTVLATAAVLIGGPAAAAARLASPGSLLRAAASSESTRQKSLRGLLVAGEIGLAVVLAFAAALMVQTLRNLQRVDPGFDVEGRLTFHLQPSSRPSDGWSAAAFYADVAGRIRALPGVMGVGAIQHLPLSGYSWNASLDVEGLPVAGGQRRPVAGLRVVTPGYFAAMGQPLLVGRDFEPADAGRDSGVIINEAMARQMLGPVRALGRRLRTRGGGLQSPWLTVVGVVADVRHATLATAPVPEIYTSVSATSIPAMTVVVRVAGDPLTLAAAARDAVRSVDRMVPVSDIQSLRGRLDASLARPRLLAAVMIGFAGLGMGLALAGVSGVVAYSTTQRRRELGIMLALGAPRSRVVRLVLCEGLTHAGWGLAAGIPAALACGRVMQALVYGVGPADPVTGGLLVVALLGTVSAACLTPAIRAARLDPLTVLRVG